MAVTLVFHGGLFQASPCSGPPRRVEVHIRLTSRVEVRRGAARLSDLESTLGAAARIDFAGARQLRTPLPLRAISDVLPIDYQGFRKTVSFDGGEVRGLGPTLPARDRKALADVKERGRFSEMRRAFERVTGISGPHHEDDEVKPLIVSFFSLVTAEGIRRWLPGYRIQVILGVKARAVVNGRAHTPHVLADGTHVEFFVDPSSTVPHFPANNPHVFERPPMS